MDGQSSQQVKRPAGIPTRVKDASTEGQVFGLVDSNPGSSAR
jgi:hypothetical protein